MKRKLLGVLLVAIVAVTQFGCSNEIEVIGVWKNIPVVYGVIDATNDTNYIRIERAYLPPNKSALEVAKDPDSLYFNPNDVEITMYTFVGGSYIPSPIPLERIDLATEGINRDTGIFADDPAYVYRLIGTRASSFKLEVKIKASGKIYEAITEKVEINSSFMILQPSYNPGTRPISWVKEVNGEQVQQEQVIDLTDNFAAIYDVGVRFYYQEYEIDGSGNKIAGTEERKVVDWKARKSFVPENENQFDVSIKGNEFYEGLTRNLSSLAGVNKRRCGGYVEFYVEGASESLRQYISAANANQGLVGGLYPAEPYSNVTEGYGILATSNRLVRTVNPLMEMSGLSYEYLADSELTRDLGFEDRTSPCY